ncbi:MAG TPA: hypothetical protein VIV11_01010 [Kofleriaceae bacterium]
MGERYEIRPGSSRPGHSRYATHSEVLLALKATAKQLGLIAKLPVARGKGWRASIQGLTVAGDTKRIDDHALETFCVVGPGIDHDKLLLFAAHIAAIAGKQAVIGETDDEFWFVDKPAPRRKKKLRKRN